MKRPVATTTVTKTSRAVRVSIGFVIITASAVALFGVAAIVNRMLSS